MPRLCNSEQASHKDECRFLSIEEGAEELMRPSPIGPHVPPGGAAKNNCYATVFVAGAMHDRQNPVAAIA